MPTTYAHWRFGDRCIATLPQELQEAVNRNRAIFDFGVHGPDIYFYYKCLKKNDVNRFGTALHDAPFGDTLEPMRARYLACDDREAALSYLLGFVCHFTLDSYCHGYIERKEEVSGISHGKLESQLDRYLLVKDGLDPVKTSVTTSLKPGKTLAHVISQLQPHFDEALTYKTLKDMKFYLDMLKDDTDLKRALLGMAMDLAGVKSFKDLMLTKEQLPEAMDAMVRLDRLGDVAVQHYPLLAASLVSFLEKGEPLEPYFQHNFCPKPDYKSIPILPLDKEEDYYPQLQD